jgi:limonene 1,2-monooxygenase
VMPEVTGSATTLVASRDWAAANRPEFIGAAGQAVMSAIQSHAAEQAGGGSDGSGGGDGG